VYEIAMSLAVGTMILGIGTVPFIVAYRFRRNNSAKAECFRQQAAQQQQKAGQRP
jgi:hypothetical protein